MWVTFLWVTFLCDDYRLKCKKRVPHFIVHFVCPKKLVSVVGVPTHTFLWWPTKHNTDIDRLYAYDLVRCWGGILQLGCAT